MFEKLDHCPVCNNEQFTNYMICEDFTVSSEKFAIVKCQNCGFLFTNPRPAAASLPQYYHSEDYISHSNRSTNPINFIYKIARKFTLNWKVNLINNLSEKGKLLDIGCGTGHFLSACQKDGWHVTGVEPDPQARLVAANLTNSPVHQDTAELLPNSYDLITLWHVLEHIPDLNPYIDRVKKLLSSKGKLLVAVPNHNSYDANIYKQFWAAYDLPRHLYHFEKATMKKLMKKHGLKLADIKPLKLDALYVSLLSESNQGKGFKKYINSIMTGLKSNSYAKKNKNNYSSLIYILHK